MQNKYSFLRSFIWVAFLAALTVSVANVVSIFFTDFVHGNPHRPQSNAIHMMILFTPFFALFGLVGALLVFGPPQVFQAILSNILSRLFDRRTNAIIIVAALPVIAVVTWYSFDYLVPTSELMEIPDGWEPYRHGMTTSRYLCCLGAQLPVTLFNVGYVGTVARKRLRILLVMLALAAVVVGGVVIGYREAVSQYGFL